MIRATVMSHRVIIGGVGHNLPQEAPRVFADAVIEVVGSGNDHATGVLEVRHG
jgi:pimeloyl-ACP methyl ester carboxylesterase